MSSSAQTMALLGMAIFSSALLPHIAPAMPVVLHSQIPSSGPGYVALSHFIHVVPSFCNSCPYNFCFEDSSTGA